MKHSRSHRFTYVSSAPSWVLMSLQLGIDSNQAQRHLHTQHKTCAMSYWASVLPIWGITYLKNKCTHELCPSRALFHKCVKRGVVEIIKTFNAGNEYEHFKTSLAKVNSPCVFGQEDTTKVLIKNTSSFSCKGLIKRCYVLSEREHWVFFRWKILFQILPFLRAINVDILIYHLLVGEQSWLDQRMLSRFPNLMWGMNMDKHLRKYVLRANLKVKQGRLKLRLTVLNAIVMSVRSAHSLFAILTNVMVARPYYAVCSFVRSDRAKFWMILCPTPHVKAHMFLIFPKVLRLSV